MNCRSHHSAESTTIAFLQKDQQVPASCLLSHLVSNCFAHTIEHNKRYSPDISVHPHCAPRRNLIKLDEVNMEYGRTSKETCGALNKAWQER